MRASTANGCPPGGHAKWNTSIVEKIAQKGTFHGLSQGANKSSQHSVIGPHRWARIGPASSSAKEAKTMKTSTLYPSRAVNDLRSAEPGPVFASACQTTGSSATSSPPKRKQPGKLRKTRTGASTL